MLRSIVILVAVGHQQQRQCVCHVIQAQRAVHVPPGQREDADQTPCARKASHLYVSVFSGDSFRRCLAAASAADTVAAATDVIDTAKSTDKYTTRQVRRDTSICING